MPLLVGALSFVFLMFPPYGIAQGSGQAQVQSQTDLCQEGHQKKPVYGQEEMRTEVFTAEGNTALERLTGKSRSGRRPKAEIGILKAHEFC